MSFEDFNTEALKSADIKYDNPENKESSNLNGWELNYLKAVWKIDNQYKQILDFSKLDTSDENKEYLKAVKKHLDGFVNKMNLKINNLPKDWSELFKEIAQELDSHWPWVFVKWEEITEKNLESLLWEFDFIKVKNWDTSSEVIKEKYKITNYSEIESIVAQLYLKNPDKINPWEILVLLKPLKEKLDNWEEVSDRDINDIFKNKIWDLDISNIVPNEVYAWVMNYLDDWSYSINYKKIESIKNLEKVKAVLEDTYNSMLEEYGEEEIKKIFPKWCDTKEDRIDFIVSVILQQSQKALSVRNIMSFLYSDEWNAYSKSKKEYADELNWKETYFNKFTEILDDSDKDKFELQKKKMEVISGIWYMLQMWMSDNFWIEWRVSASEINLYLNKHIDKKEVIISTNWKIVNIFDEVMKENKIWEIVSALTKPNITPEEIKSIELNFVNIMSNQLRSWSSLFKNTISKIKKEDLQTILPENFDKNTKKEYEILLKNRDTSSTYKQFREEKIFEYFENIEIWERKDKSRVSNYVENEILSKKTDIVKLETDDALEKAVELPKQKELFEKMKSFWEKELTIALKKQWLDFKDYESEFNDNIKNIFISNIWDFKDKIRWKKEWFTHMTFQEFGWPNQFIVNFKRPVQNLVKSIENGLQTIENEKAAFWKINKEQLKQMQDITVKWILEKSYIHSSLNSISEFRQSYLWENEDIIKKDLEEKMFKDSIKAEKDLFDTYSNITDSFNETFVISDDNTEAIVNWAAFLAISFASAWLWVLAKWASWIKWASKGVQTTLQSLAEVWAFSVANLWYKNSVKWWLDNSDFIYTIMMWWAITSAIKFVWASKNISWKIIDTKKYALWKGVEGWFVVWAYGDPQKILQHFLKTKIKSKSMNVEAWTVNSSLAGSLTNAA